MNLTNRRRRRIVSDSSEDDASNTSKRSKVVQAANGEIAQQESVVHGMMQFGQQPENPTGVIRSNEQPNTGPNNSSQSRRSQKLEQKTVSAGNASQRSSRKSNRNSYMHHNDLTCTKCYAKRIRSDNIARLKHLKDLPKAQLVDCSWPGACRYCDDNERYNTCADCGKVELKPEHQNNKRSSTPHVCGALSEKQVSDAISMQDSEDFDLNHDQSLCPEYFDAPNFEEEKHQPPVPRFENFQPEAAAEQPGPGKSNVSQLFYTAESMLAANSKPRGEVVEVHQSQPDLQSEQTVPSIVGQTVNTAQQQTYKPLIELLGGVISNESTLEQGLLLLQKQYTATTEANRKDLEQILRQQSDLSALTKSNEVLASQIQESVVQSKADQQAKMARLVSGLTQTKARIVFQDEESVADAKLAMRQYDPKTNQQKKLATTYTSNIQIHEQTMHEIKRVFAMSDISATKAQEAATMVIAQAFHKGKKRVLWEMPAGFGKSYVMLFVAALLKATQYIDTVKLVYHEAEMMVAEQKAISLMKSKYGHDSIDVQCLNSLPGKQITVPERTLVVLDEADSAFIDHQYKIAATQGYLLGLTATGFSTMEQCENEVICGELGMLSMSSGIQTQISEQAVIFTDSPATFFARYSSMAKLVYVGPDANPELISTLKNLTAKYNLTLKADESCVAKLRDTKKSDVHVVKQARLMRGFDYRSVDSAGIALLICTPLDTKRDLLQALGRVGRTGDKGERVYCCQALINQEKQREHAEKLLFHNNTQ